MYYFYMSIESMIHKLENTVDWDRADLLSLASLIQLNKVVQQYTSHLPSPRNQSLILLISLQEVSVELLEKCP